MFELYKNNEFLLYYENKNNTKTVTHRLAFKNLLTGKKTGMWLDPTELDSTSLDNT